MKREFTVALRFHGDLTRFLRRKVISDGGTVRKRLGEKTSVKDVIESCGVPHPEVDLILVGGAPVTFEAQLEAAASVEVFPVPAPAQFQGEALQRRGITRFVADVHLGSLVRRLRLLGIDVASDRRASDLSLVALSVAEERALLTRDRRLLMHAALRDGYCPRSTASGDQLVEVIGRFGLAEQLTPFTRCLACNARLEHVDKSEVIGQLEPLTRIYYDDFRRCTGCGKIYWRGSHHDRLRKWVAEAVPGSGPERI